MERLSDATSEVCCLHVMSQPEIFLSLLQNIHLTSCTARLQPCFHFCVFCCPASWLLELSGDLFVSKPRALKKHCHMNSCLHIFLFSGLNSPEDPVAVREPNQAFPPVCIISKLTYECKIFYFREGKKSHWIFTLQVLFWGGVTQK